MVLPGKFHKLRRDTCHKEPSDLDKSTIYTWTFSMGAWLVTKRSHQAHSTRPLKISKEEHHPLKRFDNLFVYFIIIPWRKAWIKKMDKHILYFSLQKKEDLEFI